MTKKNKKNITGQSFIEFIMILPVLVLIIFAIAEFSLLFYDKNVLISASREGARYGVKLGSSGYPSTAQVVSYTKTFCNNNLITFSTTTTNVTVTATPSTNTPQPGNTLKVTVTYTYTGLSLPKLINSGNPYNLITSTTMVYE